MKLCADSSARKRSASPSAVEVEGEKPPVLITSVAGRHRRDPCLCERRAPGRCGTLRGSERSGVGGPARKSRSRTDYFQAGGPDTNSIVEFFEVEDADGLGDVVLGDDEVVFREAGDGLAVLAGDCDGLHDEPRLDFDRERLVLGQQRVKTKTQGHQDTRCAPHPRTSLSTMAAAPASHSRSPASRTARC